MLVEDSMCHHGTLVPLIVHTFFHVTCLLLFVLPLPAAMLPWFQEGLMKQPGSIQQRPFDADAKEQLILQWRQCLQVVLPLCCADRRHLQALP
jgi:hypothetical protein